MTITWQSIYQRLQGVSWRASITRAGAAYVASLGAVAIVASLLAVLVGPISDTLVSTWVIVMANALLIGYWTGARWWLVWLLGTLMWESGWLVLCLSELMPIYEG